MTVHVNLKLVPWSVVNPALVGATLLNKSMHGR